MRRYHLLRFLSTLLLIETSWSFLPALVSQRTRPSLDADRRRFSSTRPSLLLYAAKYGPVMDPNDSPRPSNVPNMDQQKRDLRSLIDQLLSVKDPQHIPSLLTKNLELVLQLSERNGAQVVQSILDDVSNDGSDEAVEKVSEVIDVILSFAEDFVDQATNLEDNNKKLLGKIILTLSNKENTSRDREEALDELLIEYKSRLTPGFLRHIEGECERIANAPKMSPEGSRLLEILRMIQVRVVEELGKDLGEAAQVLGQLIGYENKAERLAVLEAGLTVRGREFAIEILSLSEEALDGFSRVPQVDQELVACVESVRDRVRRFVDENEPGFQ